MNKTPYLKIKEAATETGLSQYFLRRGCRDGTIPCVKSGTTFYVNVPALLDKLASEQGQLEGRAV